MTTGRILGKGKLLVFPTAIGKATTGKGDIYQVMTSLNGSPAVVNPDGRIWVLSWKEVLEQAQAAFEEKGL